MRYLTIAAEGELLQERLHFLVVMFAEVLLIALHLHIELLDCRLFFLLLLLGFLGNGAVGDISFRLEFNLIDLLDMFACFDLFVHLLYLFL